jgi:hypothetical protein
MKNPAFLRECFSLSYRYTQSGFYPAESPPGRDPAVVLYDDYSPIVGTHPHWSALQPGLIAGDRGAHLRGLRESPGKSLGRAASWIF